MQPASSSTQTFNTPISYGEDYSKDSDGKPCYAWNWGKDCGFQVSHETAPDNLLHICAWCAYKFKHQLLHKEQDCLKKHCFLDKKTSASTAATNAVSEKLPTDYVHTLNTVININIPLLVNHSVSLPHNVIMFVPDTRDTMLVSHDLITSLQMSPVTKEDIGSDEHSVMLSNVPASRVQSINNELFSLDSELQ